MEGNNEIPTSHLCRSSGHEASCKTLKCLDWSIEPQNGGVLLCGVPGAAVRAICYHTKSIPCMISKKRVAGSK